MELIIEITIKIYFNNNKLCQTFNLKLNNNKINTEIIMTEHFLQNLKMI